MSLPSLSPIAQPPKGKPSIPQPPLNVLARIGAWCASTRPLTKIIQGDAAPEKYVGICKQHVVVPAGVHVWVCVCECACVSEKYVGICKQHVVVSAGVHVWVCACVSVFKMCMRVFWLMHECVSMVVCVRTCVYVCMTCKLDIHEVRWGVVCLCIHWVVQNTKQRPFL